ncbi:hypothetical protein IHE45_12G009500 [Dioscorea alata]|uniref:Uncharacterized protein n=2 Tax=Dioscorea alata TaxID=55571 RepID=A0ACB7V009_DIOAL|nr:hypothetical protein IHE45_12G009500 [Dioscorea alata]KAH7666643.1 hypothetical protein IHE45_12G009500 [Dioscorea alata]
MGQDKVGVKSGGFFHLFDWNHKSRKKLFSNATNSQEGSTQENKIEDNMSVSRLRMIDDDEIAGVSSIKGSSDFSCASSVTDEEGAGSRVPGVVARLMGLDSLPTACVSEPHCTPLFDTRSVRGNHGQKRNPEFCINDQFSNVHHRAEVYSKKPMELRTQKMPSSPIERFQTEMLPFRSAKSLPINHSKLLSPIRNPGFTPPKNAAHIVEAAAKMIEPGLQLSTKSKTPLFGSSSIALKHRDSKESITVAQRTSKLLQSSRKTADLSDFKQLRGQSLDRSWNGSDDTSVSRSTVSLNENNTGDERVSRRLTGGQDSTFSRPTVSVDESNQSGPRGRGRSVSLAIQAKVNVQKREGLSTSSRSTLTRSDRDDCKQNSTVKNSSITQRSKLQKKVSTSNGSGVLRQNNQKQNCSSVKEKLPPKQSVSIQQGRKVLSGDASSTRVRNLNKLNGNNKNGFEKESMVVSSDFDKEGLSSINKDFPRKKRLIERTFYLEKSMFTDNTLSNKYGKHVKPNIVIGEHSSAKEDNGRNGTDVVSFTFTSPMIKSMPGQSYSQAADKQDKSNVYSFTTSHEKLGLKRNEERSCSLGLNAIKGDALSLLLEQKLRELTSGDNFVDAGPRANSAHVLQGSSAFDSPSTSVSEHESEITRMSWKDNLGIVFDYGSSSSNDQVHKISHKSQVTEGIQCSTSSDAHKMPDHQHPSPMSILEASFSNESCNSSESSTSINGGKCSSVQTQSFANTNATNKATTSESEIDLSDSASSSFTETADTASEDLNGLDYVKDILFSTGSMFKDLGSCYVAHVGEALDPLLYEKLEIKRSKESRLKRKVLFDCVNECLDLKCGRYFRSGYRTWSQGVAVVGKDLAEELYQEISSWKSMGDWIVDELVDKDMSSHLGKWTDFEIESFEAGVDIEEQILSSLIDELATDSCV